MNTQKTIASTLVVLLSSPVFAVPSFEEASFEVANDSWKQISSSVAAPVAKDGPRTQPAEGEPSAGSAAIGMVRPTRPLNIFVLMGNKAINSIHTSITNALVVEVRDDRNLPVEGADVLFRLPASGPGGFFPGQQMTWSGRTDLNGQVVAPGFTPNQERGRFGIDVAATRGVYAGHSIISQTNVSKPVAREAPKESKGTNWWRVIAIAAGCGAAAGIVMATHGGGKPTVTLQPGPILVGGPR